MMDNDEDWSSDENEDDEIDTNEAASLFYPICSQTTGDPSTSFSTLQEALDHDISNNNFDFLEFLPSPNEEEFLEECIICVNKCRSFVLSLDGSGSDQNVKVGESLKEYLIKEQQKRNNRDDDDDSYDGDDMYFRPILEDDSMLLHLDDLQDILLKRSMQQKMSSSTSKMPSDSITTQAIISELQLKLAEMEQKLQNASSFINKLTNDDSDSSDCSVSSNDNAKNMKRKQKRIKSKPDNDTYYFTSYSESFIHKTMLQDHVRTKAYQDAILSNASTLFKNKIVMDIGCGTGILSLFAAKAGAKKVIAIDASDVHVEAREIIKRNGYSDIITVLHGKVEDLIAKNKLPLNQDEKVNVIVSEWMGYALLYETMLPSVMVARDTLMDTREGMGTMFPTHSTLYIEGASDAPTLDFWDDVYGFDMKPMKTRVVRELRKEAGVEVVKAESIVTDRAKLNGFDLNTCRNQDLDFEVLFQLKPLLRNDDGDTVSIHKLVISFDIDFETKGSTNAVHFSTGCQSEPTHWKQTVIWFDPIAGVPMLSCNEIMKGSFRMSRNDTNPRDMDFFISWEVGKFTQEDNDDFAKRDGGIIMSKLES